VRIPSLDGLRAISIPLAIWGNAQTIFVREVNPGIAAYAVAMLADLGVGIFFVISEFLITTLLVQEQAKSGEISLKQFISFSVVRIPLRWYWLVLHASI
jgi:peptidoglycan/LPS O-acetylase OafA/YrhL